MRPLPKSLQKLVKSRPEVFAEGWSEQDGFGGNGVWSHWLSMKPGWINPFTETHVIHEVTVKEVRSAANAIERCNCSDCQRELKRKSKRS